MQVGTGRECRFVIVVWNMAKDRPVPVSAVRRGREEAKINRCPNSRNRLREAVA